MTLSVILAYIVILLVLTLFSTRRTKRTAGDYFLASRGIGPFMLLMSLFGTTMTAFALVGSTGRSFSHGIGVYGLMASWSAIVHSACFFFIGTKVWALGKKHGYVTQIGFFRDRFRSEALALLLFPVVVLFVMIYILMGIVAAGHVIENLTPLSYVAGTGLICLVVLVYVFFGGMRATAWANTFQTLVFMIMGVVAFVVITNDLGGPVKATETLMARDEALRAEVPGWTSRMVREGHYSELVFLTYCFIPMSVGMFPHIFQHWLTARRASTFKLSIVAHPVCILITWLPCVLVGMWASGELDAATVKENVVLPMMVALHSNEFLAGLIGAGILAAIMSSMDSQFLCLGSIFTNDIIAHYVGRDRYESRQLVVLGRFFVALIAVVAFSVALLKPGPVFSIGVWCFTGFAGLVPLVIAAIYWKRANKQGAIAAVLTVAALWVYYLPDALGGGFLLLDMMPVTTIVAASSLVLIVVTLLTPPPPSEIVRKFFPGKP